MLECIYMFAWVVRIASQVLFDLPRDLVLERLSCLKLLRVPLVQGSQEVVMPRPVQGPNS